MYQVEDTIAAIASAPGGAARGIVRLSGSGVAECLAGWFCPRDDVALADCPAPSRIPGELRLAHATVPLAPLACDLFYWPGTRSYTREPVAELHTFGSPPLLEAILAEACRRGARPAEPGEFTLRAFLAGRLDLTQAEAVLGVIDAGGDAELRRALEQLAGGLATPLAALRNSLLDLLAHLEAGLDFVDEDIEFISTGELLRQLDDAARAVRRIEQQMRSRGALHDRLRAVLVGWPNAGKSSLFNALIGREGAIVADRAGTTRDYVTAEFDCDGIACQLIDTAGFERSPSAEDALRQAAQVLGTEQRGAAHVEIFCLDATRHLNDWEQQQLAAASPRRIVVLTKCDARYDSDYDGPALRTSSRTGEGLIELRAELARSVRDVPRDESSAVATTAARCREHLRQAAESLERARQVARDEAGEELVAAEIRVGLDALGRVVGTVYTDDVLDRIFSRFCIGK